MLPRRTRSGSLKFFCKEQDFLHYVLNDGDNIYGIWGGCVHHIAPFPDFWFLNPDHTVCQESRWKLGTWLRLWADCVIVGSQRQWGRDSDLVSSHILLMLSRKRHINQTKTIVNLYKVLRRRRCPSLGRLQGSLPHVILNLRFEGGVWGRAQVAEDKISQAPVLKWNMGSMRARTC